ncbi:hypothetical protein ACQ86O_08755 [Serratia sp. L9]|uniref:hypothetical protein n=1 Tax=Serratia sp. L9 TaxID=3423946 RepID=UPI003D66A510
MAYFAQSPYFVLHQLTCQFANGETLSGPLNLVFEQQHCGLVVAHDEDFLCALKLTRRLH